MRIFVIIPAYNEEKHIGGVVDDVKSVASEVVVVDDASSDDTAKAAEDHGAFVLRHAVNRGQGAALQTGNEYALRHDADVVIHFDADGQHQAKDLPAFIQPLLEDKVDVVLGSRFLPGAQSAIPFSKRYLILPVARFVNRLFTGLSLSDGHNGLRAMNRKALALLRITQDRMAHNTEIPRLFAKHKLRFVEMPMHVIYHEYGQGVGDGVRILWELIKERILEGH